MSLQKDYNSGYLEEYGKLLQKEDEIALKLAARCQQEKQEKQREQDEQDDLEKFLFAYEDALKETDEWAKLQDPYVPF